MKKLILILILLSVPLALAEEIHLEKDKPYLYKIYPIQLVSVGTAGSIYIKVNQVDQIVSFNTPIEIYGLNMSLLNSDIDTQTAKINIEQSAECLIDNDCNDNISCTKDYCEMRNCKHEKQSGCEYNNECRPKGSLALSNKVLSYCDGSKWYARKKYKEFCTENYECLTNYCDNKYCKALGYLRGGEKMAPAWILIVFGALFGIWGLLMVLTPKYTILIGINAIRSFSNKFYRILGIIFLAIAAGLIIWTLI